MNLYQKLKQAQPFFLIAGPCVVEEYVIMSQVAEKLCELSSKLKIPLVFKASYSKANRSSAASASGPGIDEGLELLQRLKDEYSFAILSDVHEAQEVEKAAQVCDILQIPAFLSRQTFLIQTVAQSSRIINIKKGQFMAPEDMHAAAHKASAAGNEQVLLTERGSSFGYHNLVVDFRSFPIMAESGFPVVYDVTHSLQRPSIGKVSGGAPQYASMMAAAAMATGFVRGLFIETHPQPAKALSDAASMLPLDELEALLKRVIMIKETLMEV